MPAGMPAFRRHDACAPRDACAPGGLNLERAANIPLAGWRAARSKDRAQVSAKFFAGILIASACLSAALASWLPLQFSILTVFLFAGPHNWFELRYFLMRLPARFGRSKNFFALAFAGCRTATAPVRKQDNAVGAGAKLFREHCARCHGATAEGRADAPSLRTSRVHGKADAALFAFLTNGDLRRGMPSWSRLPDERRWQLVAYLKSL